MEKEDLYALLGLEGGGPQVSVREIRKAYKARALALHPDKQAGKDSTKAAAAAVEFLSIQDALEILGNEEARKNYDNSRKSYKCRKESRVPFRERTPTPGKAPDYTWLKTPSFDPSFFVRTCGSRYHHWGVDGRLGTRRQRAEREQVLRYILEAHEREEVRKAKKRKTRSSAGDSEAVRPQD